MIEYKFIEIDASDEEGFITNELNKFGKDGWVIKSHTSLLQEGLYFHTFLMGRNITK